MARKRVLRSLPEFPKQFALGPKEHKTERLLETLRHLAHASQGDESRAFYSMREVAARFRVPISTVSRIYHRLEREGMLSRIRGSRTTLRGLKYDRKLTVRAFVGLPASISRFVTAQDYRMFFIRIRREFRLRGFATATLFLDDQGPEEFTERIKKYEVDTIVWFQPGAFAKQTALRLGDLGIHVIGISDGEIPSISCQYEIRRDKAIEAILKTWKAADLKSIIIVSGGRSSAVTEQGLEDILNREQLAYELRNPRGEPILKFLKSLGTRENAGIVFLSAAASMLSFRAPEMVGQILQSQRVAFMDGPVNMPFAKVPDARVDLVTVNWQLVAECVVENLIKQQVGDNSPTIVFEAEPDLRVPLSTYSQVI